MTREAAQRKPRGTFQPAGHRSEGSSGVDGSAPPRRRPCPSAPQHRFIRQASSVKHGATNTAASASVAAASVPRQCRVASTSPTFSTAFADRSIDAAEETHHLSLAASSSSADKEKECAPGAKTARAMAAPTRLSPYLAQHASTATVEEESAEVRILHRGILPMATHATPSLPTALAPQQLTRSFVATHAPAPVSGIRASLPVSVHSAETSSKMEGVSAEDSEGASASAAAQQYDTSERLHRSTPSTTAPVAKRTGNTPSSCAPAAAHHSSSLTRLLQQHHQEGWRDELRRAVQQDVGVWVQQTEAEQKLLRAELSFANAKATELARELQVLRGGERAFESPPSPAHAEQKTKTASAVPEEVSERSEESDKQLHKDRDESTERTVSAAYALELESYIHSLEAQTRALHADKHNLQLRLDNRTAQLASAQRRYEQNYALLLHEQAVLEADYQKAVEEVEEVVAMVVVARAAEQAALRRLNEYEVALEAAEARLEMLEMSAPPSPSSLVVGRAGYTPSAAQGLRTAVGSGEAPLINKQTSASFSHYYSCVEASGGDGTAAVSLTDGSSTPLSSTPQFFPATTTTAAGADACFPAERASSVDGPDTSVAKRATVPPLLGFLPHSTAAEARSTAEETFHDASTTSAPSLPFSSGGVDLHLPVPLPTPPPLISNAIDAQPTSEATFTTTTTNTLPRSPSRSGNRLLTPLATSLAALLTPRSLAKRRSTVMYTATTQDAALSDESHSRTASPPSTEELLRFKCTLLELELQSKEKLHQEEKERWESAVCSAAGVHTVMGEVEARVRQVHASSHKVQGLLHEMNCLWCNSIALEDACDNEDDGGDDKDSASAESGSRRRQTPELFVEEALLTRPSSFVRLSSSASALRYSGGGDGQSRWGSRRSPDTAGTGREFFGIEGPMRL